MNVKLELPIRVAQVMGKFVPGGIKSVLMNRYRNIDRSRVQFDFVVEEGSASAADYEEVRSLGACVFEIPPIGHTISYDARLRSLLDGGKYNIVHSYMNTLNVFPMRSAYKAHVAIRIAENLSTAHKGEPKTVIKQILRPANVRYPTHLAANSEFSAEWMYGSRKQECEIIRNAIDLDAFRFDERLRNVERANMGWNDKFVIGHVGRFQYQKNHDFLIDVFRVIADMDSQAVLALVGYGVLEGKVREKVSKYGLTSRVVFLGAREDLPGIYNSFDCFVLPSFYEGLPVVAIEAQATGLPCVLSSEVTAEAAILDTAELLPLSAGAEEWASKILESKIASRKRDNQELKLAGYDAHAQGEHLTNYYIDLLERVV